MARDYEKCLSSMCHHVSNDSYYGKPFLLEPFQRENIWKPIFATGSMEGGRFKRRFRRVIIGLPSGYGKTELAAATVLTVATMEVIHNGQYGVVASSKDQVRNIFEKIATMIKLNDTWKSQWDIGKDVITHNETGAKIMVLPNKPDALESWHFNVLIFDELHVYKDSKVWDAGLKGQKVLWNPLSIGITTCRRRAQGLPFGTPCRRPTTTPACTSTGWASMTARTSTSARAGNRSCAPLGSRGRASKTSAAWPRPRGRSSATPPTASRPTGTRTRASPRRSSTDASAGRTSSTSTVRSPSASTALRPETPTPSVAYQERKNKRGTMVGYTKSWIFDTPDEDTGHYPLNQIHGACGGRVPRALPGGRWHRPQPHDCHEQPAQRRGTESRPCPSPRTTPPCAKRPRS
ncbi:MAG: terminase large subunit domain-containing protein [Collinsella sp.]